MWIVNPNNGDPNWVEAGIIFGKFCEDQSCVPPNVWYATDNTRFFWEDNRQNSGFIGHIDGNDVVSLGTSYHVGIWKLDSTDWHVAVGPYDSNKSTNNPLSPTLIRAGTETTSTSPTVCSGQSNLEWEGASDNWHTTGWDDNSGPPSEQWDAPPFATTITSGHQWMSQYSWVREWSNRDYATCWPNGASDRYQPRSRHHKRRGSNRTLSADVGSPLTEPEIGQVARQAAAQLGGDGFPSSIEHVAGLHAQTVFALTRDTVSGSNNVDAIVMHGQFALNGWPVPSDAPVPKGSTLTVIVDANTGGLMDFMLGDQSPNLAALGPVTTDQ
jgi:hypothetical protein